MHPLMRLFNLKGGAEHGENLSEWAAEEITRLRAENSKLWGWYTESEQMLKRAKHPAFINRTKDKEKGS